MMFWRRLRRRRRRIIALLQFRDEMRFLPDYFTNVTPIVDGVVALDDGSTDGSGEFVARQKSLLRMISLPNDPDRVWDDAMNHRRLVEAAWGFDPDWLLGLDADERMEQGFRERAEKELDRAEREDIHAYRLRFHELWDDPLQFRADGVWAEKFSPRFFRSRRDHEFHMQRLHCYWAPLNSMKDGDFPRADLNVYHLRMLDAADRQARRRRYEELDPDGSFQRIGYAYLTDTAGIRVEPIPRGREYRPLPR